MDPVYYECDNCGCVTKQVHRAAKREYFQTFGEHWVEKTTWLCCECIQFVGGTCDGH